MFDARITVDPAFRIGPVDRRLFGSFVEHMGRCVYTGIYEPGHPTADDDGLRQDVLELTRELGVTTIRYPGGNFVSGYRWEDGVGPVGSASAAAGPGLAHHRDQPVRAQRVHALGPQGGVEPDDGRQPGHQGRPEAAAPARVRNHPGGTVLSDRRMSIGATEPHDVRMWCLGNEMDGPWQTGHKTADEYGRLAAETAKAMRQSTPASNSSPAVARTWTMPTFGAWEAKSSSTLRRRRLRLAALAYYEPDRRRASFLACGRHGPVHRGGDRHGRPRGPRAAHQAAQSLLRRVERLVHDSASTAEGMGGRRG